MCSDYHIYIYIYRYIYIYIYFFVVLLLSSPETLFSQTIIFPYDQKLHFHLFSCLIITRNSILTHIYMFSLSKIWFENVGIISHLQKLYFHQKNIFTLYPQHHVHVFSFFSSSQTLFSPKNMLYLYQKNHVHVCSYFLIT